MTNSEIQNTIMQLLLQIKESKHHSWAILWQLCTLWQ